MCIFSGVKMLIRFRFISIYSHPQNIRSQMTQSIYHFWLSHLIVTELDLIKQKLSAAANRLCKMKVNRYQHFQQHGNTAEKDSNKKTHNNRKTCDFLAERAVYQFRGVNQQYEFCLCALYDWLGRCCRRCRCRFCSQCTNTHNIQVRNE